MMPRILSICFAASNTWTVPKTFVLNVSIGFLYEVVTIGWAAK